MVQASDCMIKIWCDLASSQFMLSDESKYDLETCHACGNRCYSLSLIVTATFSG